MEYLSAYAMQLSGLQAPKTIEIGFLSRQGSIVIIVLFFAIVFNRSLLPTACSCYLISPLLLTLKQGVILF